MKRVLGVPILSITQLLMGAPVISPIPKVTVHALIDQPRKQLKKENFKRGLQIQVSGLFKIRVWEVSVPLPTMYGVFNFTRMKSFTNPFLLAY